MEKKYWIRINEESKGPYSLKELMDMNIQPNDYIWAQGFENWIKLEDVGEYTKYLNENKKNNFSAFVKYVLIASLGVFFLLFIYNFFKLPFYKENYGGGNGMDIIGEVAFDNSPTNLKIPTLLFFYFFPIILVLTILYGIIKPRKETKLPIYLSLFLLFGIPILLTIHRPKLTERLSPNNITSNYPLQNEKTVSNQTVPIYTKKYVIVHLKTIDNSGSGYDENGMYQTFVPVEKDNVTGISEYEYFDETEKAKLEDMVVSKYLNSIDAKVYKGRVISKTTYVFDSYIEASEKRNKFLID